MSDELVIAGRGFRSRLIVGTGKYRSLQEMARAHAASGADMVTVAVRRVNLTDRTKESLLDYIDREKIFILPNTAGCYNADEAVRAARLGREAGLSNWVKLEVIGDQQTLFPDTEERITEVPMIVDAGVGTASDAAVAMELGADGVLMNTAIAEAQDAVLMAEAMRDAVIAGRKSYLAGRMPKRLYASASSPLSGVVR